MQNLIEVIGSNKEAIIACREPSYWKKKYPDQTFVDFRDIIHHVYNRPVFIYGLDQFMHMVCKDIAGWCEEEH